MFSVCYRADVLQGSNYCHRNHYQINSSGSFSPVMFLSKITELIVGELSSGSSLQDFVHGISVLECHGIGERQVVVSVMGPNKYQINSLGIFSGNDPVKELQEIIH